VMLVMNGVNLSNNFKGGPVDYWQMTGSQKHDMDEFEERLMADKSTIEFIKYVKEIHVLMKPNKWVSPGDKEYEELNKAAAYSKKRADELGVPIFFYDDKVAYFNNAKDRAIKINTEAADPDKKKDLHGTISIF